MECHRMASRRPSAPPAAPKDREPASPRFPAGGRRDKAVTGVGDQRRSGVGDQRDRFAACQLVDQLRGGGGLIVLVVADRRALIP